VIITKPHLCTRLGVWEPKYSAKYADYGEAVALLHKRKVDFASPIIIVEFPKAKHLQGQRFAIRKKDAQKHELGDNGSAPMYIIPMSHFESWESGREVSQTAFGIFSS
jgi:hypothetical protein